VIGARKKEEQTGGGSMTSDAGKGEPHAHKTGQRLAPRVLPPLHMSCFPWFRILRRYAARQAITALSVAQKEVKLCPWRYPSARASHKR
jgi:hypothetical protein